MYSAGEERYLEATPESEDCQRQSTTACYKDHTRGGAVGNRRVCTHTHSPCQQAPRTRLLEPTALLCPTPPFSKYLHNTRRLFRQKILGFGHILGRGGRRAGMSCECRCVPCAHNTSRCRMSGPNLPSPLLDGAHKYLPEGPGDCPPKRQFHTLSRN